MINSWNQPSQLWFGISYHANGNKEPCSFHSVPNHPSSCSLILNCEEASCVFQECFILTLFPLIILYLNCLSLPIGSIPYTISDTEKKENKNKKNNKKNKSGWGGGSR